MKLKYFLQFFLKRERETFPQEKKQLDDKLNDALKNCKRHGYVTNLMFQKIHENVGIIGKRHAAPNKNMRSFLLLFRLYIWFFLYSKWWIQCDWANFTYKLSYCLSVYRSQSARGKQRKSLIFKSITRYLIQVMNHSLYKQTIAIYNNTGFAQLA